MPIIRQICKRKIQKKKSKYLSVNKLMRGLQESKKMFLWCPKKKLLLCIKTAKEKCSDRLKLKRVCFL